MPQSSRTMVRTKALASPPQALQSENKRRRSAAISKKMNFVPGPVHTS